MAYNVFAIKIEICRKGRLLKRRKRKNKFNYAKRMRISVEYLQCYYEKVAVTNGEIAKVIKKINR